MIARYISREAAAKKGAPGYSVFPHSQWTKIHTFQAKK